MKMKQVIAILLCALLSVTLLSACGNPSAVTSTNSDQSVSTPESAQPEATAQTEPVTISWLAQTDTMRTDAFWQQIINDFESKNPAIKIKWSTYPDVNTKLDYIKTLFASGQMPDVVFSGLEDLYKVDGALMELPEDVCSNFQDAALYKMNGKTDAVAFSKLIMQNMFYNKNIFEKYGLKAPNSWEEFVNICKTLKDNGVTPLVSGAQAESVNMIINPMMNAFLYDISPDYAEKLASGAIKFDGPEITDIISKYVDLWNSGYYYDGSKSIDIQQSFDVFDKGNAAMTCSLSIYAKQLQDNANNFDVGWFPVPGPKTANVYPVMYSDMAGISAKTEYPEQSLALLNYLLGDDVWLSIVKTQNLTAASKKPLLYEVDKATNEVMQKSSQITPVTAFMKLPSHPTGAQEAFRTACINAVYGGDIQKAFSGFEKKYRELQGSAK
jgi:raffinose/stachyose/melibiose transport system substrate-binding protein